MNDRVHRRCADRDNAIPGYADVVVVAIVQASALGALWVIGYYLAVGGGDNEAVRKG